MYIFESIIFEIKNKIKELLKEYNISDFYVEPTSDNSHGDIYSNIALVSAKIMKSSPKKIAEMIVSNLKINSGYIEKIEIAGPGFINFFLSQKFFSDSLKEIQKYKDKYGWSLNKKDKKIMIEFVSANPTGPMHIGNARLGSFGDCLSNLLKISGYDVYKEFYVNDAGNQIQKFGISLDIRYKELCNNKSNEVMPENCYNGEDIIDLAKMFFKIYGDSYINKDEKTRINALIDFALPKNINRMKTDMEAYKIIYDNWFYESDLHNNGEIQKIIDILKEKNLVYKKDNSLWYKATEFGSEKDEVLIRQNGLPTYFAADIAYHYNKFVTRKFDICIDIWGADHHGHVERMKGAMEALGINRNRLNILLVQLVKLIKDGQPFKMSKRSGKSVCLADLVKEVGANSARFIFNNYDICSGMDFDLDLAVAKNFQNPVYYVQYAYARICSIFRNIKIDEYNLDNANLDLLNHESEKNLIYFMNLYPLEIERASSIYDSTKITKYVINLASLLHKFYSSCKVLSEDKDISIARLVLCNCVKIVIKNILDILKIDAPELMD